MIATNAQMKKTAVIFVSITLSVLSVLISARFIAAEATYSNPVYKEDFSVIFNGQPMTIGIGDPTVILHDGIYYMYATGDNRRYNAYSSPDLVNWQKGPVVFTTSENGLWAPDVFYNTDDDKFYLYYTVNRRIGVAVSERPDKPFSNKGSLVNDAIDAHMFQDDDGRYYLYYATYPWLNIYVQEMRNPLEKKDKPPVKLLEPASPWEKKHIHVTEAPWLLKHNEVYYLLYSGGGSDSMDYAMGYATARSPTGPFRRYPGNPIIKKEAGIFGPGHGSVTKDRQGTLWMVYHQKQNAQRDWMRFIAIDPLWFDDNGVLHGRATRSSKQPAPVIPATAK